MSMILPRRQRGGQQRREFKSKTAQWKQWKGLNLTDDRTAIDDDEVAWLENCMLIGKGALQVIPGPGATIATIAAGITSLWGFNLNSTNVLISVNSDGSMSQITTGGVVTAICAAGTVDTTAHLTIWRGSTICIVGPTKGYMQWDGATFTTVDASKTGTSIAVFEGRVWIGSNRTITYTAPNTNNDFTAANGAGSTQITDEAFQGNITALVSALEQLWVVGASAIEAISNVTATGSPVVTTFSITNIGTDIGSNSETSVRGYFRSLVLAAPFGFYALSGVTPQKLSDKLDGLFPNLTLTGDIPSAVGVVQNKLCLFFQVTYNGTQAQAQIAAGITTPIPMLLGFTEGKWFLAVQRTTLKWITTVTVNGSAQVWAADTSGNIYQCFGASSSTAVLGRVSGKLFDHGRWDQKKQMYKLGLQIRASAAVNNLVITADTEANATNVFITESNAYTLLNASGGVLQLINNIAANLNLIGQGLVLGEGDAPIAGNYLGWTVTFNDPPFAIVSVNMEYTPSREHAVGPAS